MIRRPRLLDEQFREVRRLNPCNLAATLSLTPLSTVSMSLAEGEERLSLRQWVEVYGEGGSLGLFRVNKVSTQYGNKQNVELEHALCTLDDVMILLPDDEDGNSVTSIKGTMQEILSAILAKQPVKRWKLGTVALRDGEQYEVTADRSTALEALKEALKKAYGYYLDFDFSTHPWTLNLKAMPSAVSCECRLSRNMDSVSISYDDSDLCTRAHAMALENGYMDADTVKKWGVIGKAIDVDDNTSREEAAKVARAFLQEHKNPAISIDITAARLAEETGESLDAFELGMKCRVALPEWGLYEDETIVSVQYSDMIESPKQAKLTLAKPERDLSTMVAKVRQEARSAGRGARGAKKTIQTEFKRTYEYIKLSADKIANVELVLNGRDGTGGLVAEVTNSKERISAAEININGVEATVELKVDKNGVIAAINVTPEEATIQAKKINLSGYVTATQLEAVSAKIDNLTSGNAKASYLNATVLHADTASIGTINRRVIGWKQMTIDGSSYYVMVGLSGGS